MIEIMPSLQNLINISYDPRRNYRARFLEAPEIIGRTPEDSVLYRSYHWNK